MPVTGLRPLQLEESLRQLRVAQSRHLLEAEQTRALQNEKSEESAQSSTPDPASPMTDYGGAPYQPAHRAQAEMELVLVMKTVFTRTRTRRQHWLVCSSLCILLSGCGTFGRQASTEPANEIRLVDVPITRSRDRVAADDLPVQGVSLASAIEESLSKPIPIHPKRVADEPAFPEDETVATTPDFSAFEPSEPSPHAIPELLPIPNQPPASELAAAFAVDEVQIMLPTDNELNGPAVTDAVFSFDEPELPSTPRPLPRVTQASAEFEMRADREPAPTHDENEVVTEESFWSYARDNDVTARPKRTPQTIAPVRKAPPAPQAAKRSVRRVQNSRSARLNDLKMRDWPEFR